MGIAALSTTRRGEPSVADEHPLPSWPVDLLLWGFPAYWVLGLTPFVPVGLAAIMAALLLVRRRVLVVPGVLPWFAFCAWIVPSAMMLDDPLRIIGYSVRFANIIAVGIVLVYVLNAPTTTPRERVMGGLVVVWALVVVGGYLGMFFPDVQLRTPAAIALPGAITANEHVALLVSPPFAEVQSPWGAPESYVRPSAPFPYANSWGSALMLFTPIAIATLGITRSARIRVLIVFLLAASTVPAIASLNRGMFIGLVVAISYAIVRLGLRGRPGAFIAASLIGAVGMVGFVLADVTGRIAERQQYSDTTSGRAAIYRETFERTLESPLLGYGAPRPSFTGGIAVGTQGYIWLLMFSYGFVGLALFLTFLWGMAWRTRHAPTTSDIWLHSTIMAASIAIAYYSLDTMQMLAVALSAALLLRSIHPELEAPQRHEQPPPPLPAAH